MKQRRGRKRIIEITYCISILDYDVAYHISLPPRDDIVPGPYWEHVDLKLSGRLIHPEKFKDRALQLSFLSSRNMVLTMQDPIKYRSEPLAVGELVLRGQQSSFLGSIPQDVLPFLCHLIDAGKIKFVMLGGPSLYGGRSAIRSISFEKEFIAGEW